MPKWLIPGSSPKFILKFLVRNSIIDVFMASSNSLFLAAMALAARVRSRISEPKVAPANRFNENDSIDMIIDMKESRSFPNRYTAAPLIRLITPVISADEDGSKLSPDKNPSTIADIPIGKDAMIPILKEFFSCSFQNTLFFVKTTKKNDKININIYIDSDADRRAIKLKVIVCIINLIPLSNYY